MEKKQYKKYLIVANLWKQGQYGRHVSMKIDAGAFDALQKIELGGLLRIEPVHPKTKEAKGPKFPDAFLEYLTPQEVEEEKQEYLARREAQKNEGL